jgi:LPS sulfotransferase NodH
MALTAGKTSNGVFGGRIMAETLPELSWAKPLQTHFWHPGETVAPKR